MKKFILVFILISQISFICLSKNSDEEIIEGTGWTQLDAIVNSVDNILSQKYSTWTSAMTKMVNDEITRSKNVSTPDPNANVTKYRIISLEQNNGNWTVKAKVKTGKASALLKQIKRNYTRMASASPVDRPANPMYPFEFDDNNQEFKVGQILDKKMLGAIVDMCRADKEIELLKQLVGLLEIYQDGMFDYDADIEKLSTGQLKVNVTVNKNKNTYNMAGLVSAFLYSSARAIDNNPTEVKQIGSYSPTFGMPSYDLIFDAIGNHFFQSYGIGYELYHFDAESLERAISTILTSGIFGFKIIDNLGNERYVKVSADGTLKKVGTFKLNPEYKESLPLFCGLGNTRILMHSVKVFTESKSVIRLEFTIPYSKEDFGRVNDVVIEPFNQELTNVWNRLGSNQIFIAD